MSVAAHPGGPGQVLRAERPPESHRFGKLVAMHPTPAFATDPATAAYYDRRAGEYDEWYTGEGLFALRDRPGWDEVRRVAGELVVVDSARRQGVDDEQSQERILNDGSRHRVYKRYFTGEQLATEIGGEAVLDGAWFVAARVSW